jgi:hypothetical protein
MINLTYSTVQYFSCRKTLKWPKAAVGGFQQLVSLVESGKELGVSRTDLLGSIPRLEEALTFALEKYIILEVGIGKEDSVRD